MEKNYKAVFSIKMNERSGEGFNSNIRIEGRANDLLNCLEVGLSRLYKGGIPKELLHDIVDVACKDNDQENTKSEESALFDELLKDAPKEIREIAELLLSMGTSRRGESNGENKK